MRWFKLWLWKIQDCLFTDNLSTEEKQLVFKLRTQTYPCKANFRKLYEPDLSCPICPEEDRPEHLLNCTSTTQGIDTNSVQFSDIFGNLNQQTKIIKVLKQIIVNRNLILQETPTLGSQVHPVWCLVYNWRERAAFQRLAFGRSTAGNDVVATIFIRIFFPPRFFPPVYFSRFSPSRPFLIEGVLGSKNLFGESCLERPKT